LFVLVVFGVLGVKCTANFTGLHKTVATNQADEFARELGLEVQHVACVKQDTDGDGYIACTFKLKDGSTQQFECAGAMNLNEGCREPKINVRDGGRLR
jgi:hypothetical protein